jgi:hypothetical protein
MRLVTSTNAHNPAVTQVRAAVPHRRRGSVRLCSRIDQQGVNDFSRHDTKAVVLAARSSNGVLTAGAVAKATRLGNRGTLGVDPLEARQVR